MFPCIKDVLSVTCILTKRKTSKISLRGLLAGPQGFEPWMTESESVALPLGDGPMLSQQMVLYIGYSSMSTTFFIFLKIFYIDNTLKKIAGPAYLSRHKWSHRPIPIQPYHWYAQLPLFQFPLCAQMERGLSYVPPLHIRFP